MSEQNTPSCQSRLKHVMTECIDHGFKGNEDGYGLIKYDKKLQYAHRVAYCIANGLSIYEIKGKVIRHQCDNPRCVNHQHLLIGTLADNNRDMVERGRYKSPIQRKLTDEQVREIRANCIPSKQNTKRITNPYSYNSLARKYGVGSSSVIKIVKRRTYKDVV